MRFAVLTAALFLAACGSPSKTATEALSAGPKPAPVSDHRLLLLAEHQTAASVVPSHLLGSEVLPGGSLGEYESGAKKYQLFVIEAAGNQQAAFLMLDFKATLQKPDYIAYMGGYFGTLDDKPVYVFAKKQFLAGVVGLPRDAADPIARQLAAKL